jgi:hypothetical protein
MPYLLLRFAAADDELACVDPKTHETSTSWTSKYFAIYSPMPLIFRAAPMIAAFMVEPLAQSILPYNPCAAHDGLSKDFALKMCKNLIR